MQDKEGQSGSDPGSDDNDPPFIQKLKGQIKDGKALGLNPVKHGKFKKLMLFTDVRQDFVIFLKEYLKLIRTEGKGLSEDAMKDILTLIGTISLKSNFGTDRFFQKESANNQTELTEDEEMEKAQENYIEFKKCFSELWGEVMKWKMSSSVHRKVVILLPEKVMTHLNKPLHMSDFLLESFKLGGPVSLVSLHGIFLLMQNFNFEVPDFYTRLYSMFTSETLSSKYRARFFAYSREFLSSTHLPESLVASFIKRISRLSLFAPASALPMMFDFIINLTIQHPGLKILFNPLNRESKSKIKDLEIPESWKQDSLDSFLQTSQNETLEDPDPYNEDEPDPMKTKAIESWLCEIKTLQNHAVSSIALQAKFIGKGLPKVEKDMDKSLSLTYEELADQEREISSKLEPTPSHIKPVLDWDMDGSDISVDSKKVKLDPIA